MLGVSEDVILHSTSEELEEHTSYLLFPCIADPTNELCKKFGTEGGQCLPMVTRGV